MNTPLTRRAYLGTTAALGTATLAGLAGCLARGLPGTGDGTVRFREGFEGGLDGWDCGAHVGPEAGSFDWRIEVTDERAASGDRSLAVFTEGSHDDGVAWVVRELPVERGVAYDAAVSVRAWSASESFNTVRHLVAFLGPTPPRTEADFPAPGENSTGQSNIPRGGLREPLDLEAGWREYTFEWTTPALDADALFVAVGVAVVWETDRTDFVDEVRVRLVPRR